MIIITTTKCGLCHHLKGFHPDEEGCIKPGCDCPGFMTDEEVQAAVEKGQEQRHTRENPARK